MVFVAVTIAVAYDCCMDPVILLPIEEDWILRQRDKEKEF
jgi:hypothetical protein